MNRPEEIEVQEFDNMERKGLSPAGVAAMRGENYSPDQIETGFSKSNATTHESGEKAPTRQGQTLDKWFGN